MRYMRYRIAVSVWRLDNLETTLTACNLPVPGPLFHSLFIFAPLHRPKAAFHLCTAIFPHSVLCTLYSVLRSLLYFSTFTQELRSDLHFCTAIPFSTRPLAASLLAPIA